MSALAPSDERQGVSKPISQLVTVDDLNKKLGSLQRGRAPLDMQWKLNLAFYKGRQYSFVNRELGRVQSLPTEDGDKPRYRIRLVSNQIITGSHSLLAKYTKTKPIISATPGSGSADDAKAAQLAERLLEYWWGEFALDDKLAEAILWSIITGQGYWLIEWDQYASTPMTFTLGPDGKPITNEKIKAAFLDQLRQRGVEPQQKTVYMGDINVCVPSPFNVYLDPSAQTFDDCKYAIIKYPMDPDMVKARWGVEVSPDSVPTPSDVALSFATGQNGDEKTTKDVYCGYFLPTPSNPKGRVVWWTKGVDKPLEDKPWPWKSRKLPLIKLPGLKLPGSVYDTSHVEQAIPIQKELNRTLSQMVEYKNLTIRPRVWAPTNSLRTRLTSEPGALYEYNPVGQFKPEVEQPRALPPYVFDLLKEVSSRLADVFALTEVSEGNVPPNVEAGIAIDLLQELSADRLMPTIKLIEKQLARAGQLMLELAQQYYIEPRQLAIYGSGGAVQVRKFSQADIAGGVTVHVETGSGLPRTRAGRQAQIERWVEMQLIPADRAWKYLDIADLKGLASEMAADEDQAQREIDKLIEGEPINPEEIQNAMASVNRGVNPDTGDPLQSPQEAQQILKTAGLKPRVGENYDTHLNVLGTFMKSIEFEGLPIQTRQDFIQHWNLTLQAKMALPQMPAEPKPVQTTLQLKGTVGPTVAAEILGRSGVPMVTPEQMAEPPLETWVTDSVDKPDTDAAGAGQEANSLSQAAAVVLESNAKIADAAHQAQERKASVALDQSRKDAVHAQQLDHAEQMHQQRLNQAAETHAHKSGQAKLATMLAQKKLAQSSFKPKATPTQK
jgi:hypothetical protein